MALSYFSDYGTYQYLNPEMNDFHEMEASYGNGFLCFCDSCGNLNTLLDGFYQAEDPCSQLLPHFPPQDPSFSDNLSPEYLFQPDEFDYFHYPKRARTYADFSPAEPLFNPFDGSVLSSVPAQEFSTGFAASASALEFQAPVSGGTETKKSPGGSLSAQSVAARQRRKKISEKTQELGKLIPGGNKMNTAEMFQAAFNYVKFMEAQVALLEFMGSFQGTDKDAGGLEGYHALISSPKIQEKLYEDGKCMVPKELVGTLAMDQRLLSNPTISKDLDCLLQSLS